MFSPLLHEQKQSGDTSVIDLFLYPNLEARALNMPNMRTHTDPGLLTITRASRTPGLQIMDTSSREWRDVEEATSGIHALTNPTTEATNPTNVVANSTHEATSLSAESLILFCGESLEVLSAGRYEATPHRVRHASSPRLSVVFELRLREATRPVGGGRAAAATHRHCERSRRAAADAAAADESEPEDEAARAYMHSFVRARFTRGCTAQEVLGDFGVPQDAWPSTPQLLSELELSMLLLEWVQRRREEASLTHTHPHMLNPYMPFLTAIYSLCHVQEEAIEAFESAEYVELVPSFADCTGRFVDVVVPKQKSTVGVSALSKSQ